MNLKSNQSKWLICLACGLFLLLSVLSCKKEKTSEELPERISEFGKYEGYSEPIYEEWIRTSQYITMRDGVKLAIDIVQPAKNMDSNDPLLKGFVWRQSEKPEQMEDIFKQIPDITLLKE